MVSTEPNLLLLFKDFLNMEFARGSARLIISVYVN
jgi:hypothetical protein